MDAASVITSALRDALGLVFPVDCAGCGAHDVPLCDDCLLALAPRVHTRVIGGIAVSSGVSFEGSAARVIRSFKGEGRTGMARALAPALAAAAADASRGADATLVPIPTSRSSFRRRGFHAAELVATRAGLPIARLLRPSRQSADQRGLDIVERRRNVAASLTARACAAGARVLVLDDVVTTGATIGEAVRALEHAGAVVIGAVTIAATPRRGVARETRR